MKTEKGAAVLGIAWSHGRPRAELRRPSDGGTPPMPEAEDSEPIKDPKTGRFVKGNQAHRRRRLKDKAKGLTTLNPARCESWLVPHVNDGRAYGLELLQRFPDPALARLVGDTTDAHTMYRALLSLAAQGDGEALKESRAWLREHRACIRELTALSVVAKNDRPSPWLTTPVIDGDEQ